MKIILASNSPRRRELLKKITDKFEIVPPDVNEDIGYKTPSVLALSLSLIKAENVIEKTDGLVIGADTIVSVFEKVLGKPKNSDQAAEFLKLLNGNVHTVITGICVAHKKTRICAIEKTLVSFNKLSDIQIKEYITKFKPYDKAGSYGIQDNFPLIKSIEGDYNNVLGFPVDLIKKILAGLDYTEEKWR